MQENGREEKVGKMEGKETRVWTFEEGWTFMEGRNGDKERQGEGKSRKQIWPR